MVTIGVGQAIGSVESEVRFGDWVARPGALKPVDAGALSKDIVTEGDAACLRPFALRVGAVSRPGFASLTVIHFNDRVDCEQ